MHTPYKVLPGKNPILQKAFFLNPLLGSPAWGMIDFETILLIFVNFFFPFQWVADDFIGDKSLIAIIWQ